MPVLLIDKEKCLGNIGRMAQKAVASNLSFRPHFKTHQSAEIGNWFRDFGVSGITVSSFQMATCFANAGWKDILVAFPFNPQEVKIADSLAESCQLSILLDNPDTLPYLDQVRNRVDFYVDIDTGYGRTGIRSENTKGIEELITASQANPKLKFMGFYCHAGHSYKAGSLQARTLIHQKARQDLASLKDQFSHFNPRVLYGDTPNCSTQVDFTGIDEITPGNFVFYDLMQVHLGSCTPDEIAVAVACPVTGKYPGSCQIVVHGGAVHFSKESLRMGEQAVFGQMVTGSGNGWEASPYEAFITSVSQEHGILEGCGEWFDRIRIGDTLHFLPVHSCLTANLMREYRTLAGERIITGMDE